MWNKPPNIYSEETRHACLFPAFASHAGVKPATPLLLAACLCTSARAASLISLNFDPNVDSAQQQVYNDAAAFWNSAITGFDLVSDANGAQTPHSLSIDVSSPAIDGPSNVLGQAGPKTVNYYDDNPSGPPTHALYYTATGTMKFDSADVATMISNNTFYGVVLHEMAHVLGVGTLWTYNNNVEGTIYQLYTASSGQYTGPNALAQWQAEFNQSGATFVPVELGGGSGTADGHWNEVDNGAGNTGFTSNISGMDFRNELMTGWASSTFFLSRVTLGTLDDLGYIVDYSKAGVITYVPEPAALTLAACAGLLVFRRRRA